MAGERRHWLFKSEPDVYSIDDLKRDGTTHWDGVRNYQARNLLRDEIKKGDLVLYYHSRVAPMGAAGVARVAKSGHADPSQFDAKSKYHDPKSSRDEPRWICVDVKFVKRFREVVTLADMKQNPALAKMMVCQRGARLSVQPVTPDEYAAVLAMAR